MAIFDIFRKKQEQPQLQEEQQREQQELTAAINGNAEAGNQEKVSCFFAPIFGIFENRQYYAVQRDKKKSLPVLSNPVRKRRKEISQNIA